MDTSTLKEGDPVFIVGSRWKLTNVEKVLKASIRVDGIRFRKISGVQVKGGDKWHSLYLQPYTDENRVIFEKDCNQRRIAFYRQKIAEMVQEKNKEIANANAFTLTDEQIVSLYQMIRSFKKAEEGV